MITQPWETTIVYQRLHISNSKEERGGNADEKSEFRKYGKTGFRLLSWDVCA